MLECCVELPDLLQRYRIPCQLITHPRFKHLSTDSKLLHGILLVRMSLSIKNEWYDDTGRVRKLFLYAEDGEQKLAAYERRLVGLPNRRT